MSTQELNPNKEFLLLHGESLPPSTEGEGSLGGLPQRHVLHRGYHSQSFSCCCCCCWALWIIGLFRWCLVGCRSCGTGVVKLDASRCKEMLKWGTSFVWVCFSSKICLVITAFGWILAISEASKVHQWALSQIPSLITAVTRSSKLISLKMRSPFLFTCDLFFTF